MKAAVFYQAVLDSLDQGIIVFHKDGAIQVANRKAMALCGGRMAPGEPIEEYLCKEPLAYALARVEQLSSDRDAGEYMFLCGLKKDASIHRCRLCSLPAPEYGSSVLYLEAPVQGETAFDHVGRKIDKLRAPLTNLRAAVENLNSSEEIPQVLSSAFENIITEESHALSSAFFELAEETRRMQRLHLGVFPTPVSELVGFLSSQLTEKKIAATVSLETERSITVDSYGLLLLVVFFAAKISEQFGAVSVRFHDSANETMYLDWVWDGQPVDGSFLPGWLEERLSDSCGVPLAVKDLLDRLGAVCWSQPGPAEGKSLLRLPLTTSAEHTSSALLGRQGKT